MASEPEVISRARQACEALKQAGSNNVEAIKMRRHVLNLLDELAEARLQALEEAAALAETYASQALDEGMAGKSRPEKSVHSARSAYAIAAAIRELKKGPSNV